MRRDDEASVGRPARVLIVIQNMSYTYDTRVRSIARTLREAGAEVTIVCPRYRGDPQRTEAGGLDVRFFSVPSCSGGLPGHLLEYGFSLVAISAATLRVGLTKGFDYLHLCNPPDVLFPIGVACRGLGKRFVFDQHDLVPELFEVRFKRTHPTVQRLVRAAERWSLKSATCVLATNEAAKACVVERAQIPAEKVTVVRNAPEWPDFAHRAPDRHRGGQTVTVGYLGNINPQDGVDLLLAAARFIRFELQRTDIQFEIIGDGSGMRAVVQLADTLELGDIIQFRGRMPPDAAWGVLETCEICVQPDPKNSFTDACTMVKALEYMALGKPIVAFDLRETRLSCGDAALYARGNSPREFAECIVRLADDSALRRRLGIVGRRRIEKELSWSFSAPPLLAAYGLTKARIADPESQLVETASSS